MKPRFIHISTALAMLVAVLSCGGADSLAPSSDSTLLAGLTASGPVASASIGSNGNAINASVGPSEEVSWVSLIPGTVPDGATATIVNRRTAQSLTTAIVDGGFDPQPISANLGDSIQVSVSRVGKPDAGALLSVARPAPHLVRTRPMRGQTDAPLNTIITVVFSEPLAVASVNPTSITLTAAGEPVAGTVRVVPGPGYAVEFAPAELLAPSTTYSVTVSGVVNLAGTPLAAPISIPFTTSAPTAYTFSPETLEIRVNTHFLASGFLEIGTGESLPTTWRSRDPSIATVELADGSQSDANVVGIRPGTTIVEGTAQGTTAKISVTVLAPAPALATTPMVVDFRVLEAYNPRSDVWFYAPELVLRDTTRRGGTAVIALSLNVPGLGGFSDCHMVRPVGSSPTEVFHAFGDFALAIRGKPGVRASGSEAVATVTLRIPSPAAKMIELRGPIVHGSLPTPFGPYPFLDSVWCG